MVVEVCKIRYYILVDNGLVQLQFSVAKGMYLSTPQ